MSEVHNHRSCQTSRRCYSIPPCAESSRATSARTLVVILTVVLTIMLIRTLGQAALGRIAPQDVALLLGYVALGYLPLILSLSLFIAVVATLGRMYRDSEMAIWFSSGVGLTRFVRPVLRRELAGAGSWSACWRSLVWPWQNERGVELKERFERRSDLSRVAPGQFQTSSDGTARLLHRARCGRRAAPAATSSSSRARASNESVTSARSGRIEVEGDGRYLILSKGQRNEQNLQHRREGAVALRELPRRSPASASCRARPTCRRRRGPTLDLLRHADAAEPGRARLAPRAGARRRQPGAARHRPVGVEPAPCRATGTCCSRCSTFVVYYNVINLSQAWVGGGKVGMGVALRRDARRRVPARAGAALVARAREQPAVAVVRRAPPAPLRPDAHAHRPPPVLRRHRLRGGLRRRGVPVALLLHRLRRRARRHRRARLHGPERRRLLAAAGARPLLRAGADRGADRRDLRAGPPRADLAVHDPAHRRPRARAGALAAVEPRPAVRRCSPTSSATTWRRRASAWRASCRRCDSGSVKLGRSGAWLKEHAVDAGGRAQLLDQRRLGRGRLGAAATCGSSSSTPTAGCCGGSSAAGARRRQRSAWTPAGRRHHALDRRARGAAPPKSSARRVRLAEHAVGRRRRRGGAAGEHDVDDRPLPLHRPPRRATSRPRRASRSSSGSARSTRSPAS